MGVTQAFKMCRRLGRSLVAPVRARGWAGEGRLGAHHGIASAGGARHARDTPPTSWCHDPLAAAWAPPFARFALGQRRQGARRSWRGHAARPLAM